jgi:hypothetical protein
MPERHRGSGSYPVPFPFDAFLTLCELTSPQLISGVGLLAAPAPFFAPSGLVAHLVLGNARIAARLAFSTVRPFGFAPAAETGAHKLLASIAAHPARLRVAILHSLLLRAELGVDRAHQHGEHDKAYKTRSHGASSFARV